MKNNPTLKTPREVAIDIVCALVPNVTPELVEHMVRTPGQAGADVERTLTVYSKTIEADRAACTKVHDATIGKAIARMIKVPND